MANGNDFKGGSPWGSPPGGGNGSGRGGQRPPNIDEVIEKIQKLIYKLIPGGGSGSKPIIFGLILLVSIWAFSGLYRVLPDEQGVVGLGARKPVQERGRRDRRPGRRPYRGDDKGS